MAQVDQSETKFLRTLQRVQPATVRELISETGVTATAVRHWLTRLGDLGLIGREAVKQTRGRPQHRYRLTDSGIRVLGDETPELAVLLWQEIQSIEDAEVRERLLARVKREFVERLGGFDQNETTNLAQRVESLRKRLESRGLMAEVTLEGDLPVIREHSCPYHAVAQVDSAICDIEQEAFAEVLGTSVELSACRLDGHRCCEFQIGSSS